MPVQQGRMYKSLLLLGLLFAVAQGSGHRCCVGDATWDNSTSKCTDGSSIQLECPHGMFHLEDYENFTVHELGNSSWLSFWSIHDSLEENVNLIANVSHDSYCTSKVMGNPDAQDVALICFSDELPTTMRPFWWYMLFGLCAMVSSVFLALTLLVYLVLPEMREIQDKAVMSMTGSFMVAFFMTGHLELMSTSLDDEARCLVVALLMYYAYMSAFFWMNVVSFNIFRSVWFSHFKLQNEALFVIYCMVGWGLPLCLLAITAIAHHVDGSHLKPGFELSCWFQGYDAKWAYFYGPILMLLSINLIYLGLTSWKLWRQWRQLDGCKLKVLRFKCLMYVKLALVMGFTWIFEVISFAISSDSSNLYWMIPDLLNVLQGLFIFVLFVVSRKRVRKLLAKRRPFNIPFPKSWAAYEDLENCEQIGPEEFELSHD